MYYHKKPDPFYLSRAWRRIREVALARDFYLCQDCLARGRLRTARIVHHIKPRDMYPELALVLSNLRSLCISCHNRVHGAGRGAHAGHSDGSHRPGPTPITTARRARVLKG